MKKRFFTRIIAAVLCMANVFTIIPNGVFAATPTTNFDFEDEGQTTNFGDVNPVHVGKFKVKNFSYGGISFDERQAFCANNLVDINPTNSSLSNLEPSDNITLARVLYYGWVKPDDSVYTNEYINNIEAKIVATSTAVSHFYSGSSYANSGNAQELKEKLIALAQDTSKAIPNNNISLTKSDLNVSVTDNKQISESTTFNGYNDGEIKNSININVPSGVTLINESKSNETIVGSDTSVATIMADDTFHFEADLDFTGEVNQENIHGSLRDFRAFIATSQTTQDIITYGEVENNSSSVRIKATFTAQTGALRVHKVADDNIVEGVTFVLTGKSQNVQGVEKTATTDENGYANFTDLLIGTYTLSERDQNPRYQEFIPKDVTIESGSTLDVNIEEVENKLKIGQIRTSAKDSVTEKKYAYVSNNTTIVDEVQYEGFGENQEDYVVTGVLMDQATGQELLINGQNVTASASIPSASSSQGTVNLNFTLNSNDLKGKSVVVFEELKYKDKVLAEHKDINDENQTVTFLDPSISTQAKDEATNFGQAYVSKNSNLIDTVEYNNVAYDVTSSHRLVCKLIDKETEEEIARTSKLFNPTSSNGQIDIKLEDVDTTRLAGKSVVCYEYLYFNNELVAEHAKLTDMGQTITFKNPSVYTEAKDTLTDLKSSYVQRNTTIVDKVKLNGILYNIGKSHRLVSILKNAETGEEIARASKIINPNSANTEVEIEIKNIDTTELVGKSVVCCEYLYFDNQLVASHEDLNDPDQTVKFEEPNIKTSLKDKDSKTQEVYTKKKTTLIDTVSYTGLIIGEKYVVSGILMNKETNEPLLVDGKEIVASKEFEAKESDGTIDIEFVFDSTGLEEKEIVAFEYIDYKDIEIATHTDINDKDQTIKFVKGELPKTGGNFDIQIPIIIVSSLIAFGIALICKKIMSKREN